MITMCKIFVHFEKKIVKFSTILFLVKKGSSGKNMDIILFTYLREALFCCSGLKEGDRGKTYPVIDAPVHSKHNGVSYNSVRHSIRKKLHPFL